jgi:enamine deaminase RidA (YjgF/YER057c/UK114 family)
MLINSEILSDTGNIRLTVIREEYSPHSFFNVNLHIEKHDELDSALKYLSDYLGEKNLEILMAFCFGTNKLPDLKIADNTDPLSVLYQSNSSPVSLQLICTESKYVVLRKSIGDICIKSVDHFGMELYFVNKIFSDGNTGNYRQAYLVFQSLKCVLKEYEISNNGLSRTWLYVQDILDWYNELNCARTDFFSEESIFAGIIPASTGIGLNNISGKSLLLNALLIKTGENDNLIRMIDSPMQCPATDYKSSFSRAVEITHQTSKRLIISGTASIDREGQTLHYDNVNMQINQTMEVVSSLMNKEEYGWTNMVRAIAYFKDLGHVNHFMEYCRSNQIDSTYILIAGGTICRDDLLFEIEIDAVKLHKKVL